MSRSQGDGGSATMGGMSLYIDVDTVTAVLLADGWHQVADASFNLDAYEFVWSGTDGITVVESDEDALLLLAGGRESLVPATGFSFKEEGGGWQIAGPITSILAVRQG